MLLAIKAEVVSKLTWTPKTGLIISRIYWQVGHWFDNSLSRIYWQVGHKSHCLFFLIFFLLLSLSLSHLWLELRLSLIHIWRERSVRAPLERKHLLIISSAGNSFSCNVYSLFRFDLRACAGPTQRRMRQRGACVDEASETFFLFLFLFALHTAKSAVGIPVSYTHLTLPTKIGV